MRDPRRFIPKPTAVIAVMALILSSVAGATAATVISGADVKNGSLTGADVKRGSLPVGDLSASARRALAAPGPQGPAGPAGPPTLGKVRTADAQNMTLDSGQGDTKLVEINLPAGPHLIDAKVEMRANGSGNTCQVRAGTGEVLDDSEFRAVDQVVLQGVFTSPEGGARVRVSCNADDFMVIRDARVRALEVGAVG